MAQRYDTYKDSGVQWLGEIPGHWKVVRNKWLFKEEDEKNTDLSYQLLSFSRHKGIIPFSENTDKEPSASDLSKYKVIRKGQLLENRMQAWSGMFGCSYIEGCVSPDYSVFSPMNGADTEYYAHLYRTPLYVQQFANASKGIGDGFNRLYTPQFHKIYAIYPPLPEQHAIVAYLDDKCGKIDEWIEKKQKEVELLGEMKQRVIADAVTRGLNPNVKMKQTNIPWLPKVPEHWEVKSLRNFLTMFAEKRHGDKQLLSVTREQGVIVRNTDSKEENHNFIPEDLSNYKYVQEGDFVINKMKSWQGSYGVSEHEGIVSPAYFTCKLSGIDKSFFSTAIRSKVYVSFFGRYSKGIRVDQWDLSPIALKSIPFLLPPLSEQRAIVAYINERTAKIDKLVENVNKEIEALKEYKQRLISDVVTGQIKVC